MKIFNIYGVVIFESTAETLIGADLRGASGVPVADLALRLAVAKAVIDSPASLDMSCWHGKTECGTTHCLAGYAVALTPGGVLLEQRVGTATAGMLLLPSAAHLFYEDNETAMEWCKSVLAEQERVSK